LLNILALKRGETVNKHFLAEKLLGRYNQNGSRRMTLLVGRLRKKVMEALDCELPIATVHSIGYACVSAILIE
jgi:DNA-binding response OmpR family regulator